MTITSNNTPRQINILQALGAEIPQYAHLSMILGDDGAKLSKRHGAVSVMQYDDDGFLPEAVINYLSRLGWSHGDDEVFSRQQFVEWFDLDHITASAAQFNTEKLLWLNQHYMKQMPVGELTEQVKARLAARGVDIAAGPELEKAVALYVDRSNTLNVLADEVEVFYVDVVPASELLAQHLSDEARPALASFAAGIATVAWEVPAINALIKDTVTRHGLKMPKLAMPLRVILTGQAQTPSVERGHRADRPHSGAGKAGRAKKLKIPRKRFTRTYRVHIMRALSRHRGYSSAGRALAWHARGQRFDPAYLHQQT